MKILKVNLDRSINVGISLPMDGTNIFPTTLSQKEQLKSNLINFILTNKGERLFRPEFGTDIRKKLFEPNVDTYVLKESLSNDIERHFSNQIDLEDLVIDSDINTEVVRISVQYKLKSEFESDLINLTLN